MKEEDVKISVNIFPNGVTKPDAIVVFDSVDDKMEYVKREFFSCKKENDEYLSSFGEERIKKKEIFAKKRVEFAKANGYAPMPRNKRLWIKSVENETVNTPPPSNGVA